MSAQAAWPVLVVDDDPDVLELTQLLLDRVLVDGRPLALTFARSAAEGRKHLATTTFALAIVDVVMETDHAGLELVRDLRADERHAVTSVVVRTGQGGANPQGRIVADYAINDYWSKEDLAPSRMRAAAVGLIRAHQTALELRHRLEEREVLLREVHHRVKNNLQIVISLLNLSLSDVPDQGVGDLLREAVLRIRSMALIHDYLCKQDRLESLDLGAYLQGLSELVVGAVPAAPQLRCEVASIPLSLGPAVPVGLVATELLTNALKHGRPTAPETTEPKVQLTLFRTHCDICLIVSDNGPGLPVEPPGPGSLGLRIAHALAQQLGGQLTYRYDAGSHFTLSFAADAGHPRPMGSH